MLVFSLNSTMICKWSITGDFLGLALLLFWSSIFLNTNRFGWDLNEWNQKKWKNNFPSRAKPIVELAWNWENNMFYSIRLILFPHCTSSPRALCSGERISFTNFQPIEEGIEYFEQIIIGKVAGKWENKTFSSIQLSNYPSTFYHFLFLLPRRADFIHSISPQIKKLRDGKLFFFGHSLSVNNFYCKKEPINSYHMVLSDYIAFIPHSTVSE